VLRLFSSPQDVIENRRRARQVRADGQLRCRSCGRWMLAAQITELGVCEHCVYRDERPAIRRKVDQCKRWLSQVKGRSLP